MNADALLIQQIDKYRDGGSIKAVMVDGSVLCVDNRIGSLTKGQLYDVWPMNDALPVADPEERRVRQIQAAWDFYWGYLMLRANERSHIYKSAPAIPANDCIAMANEHRKHDLSYPELIARINA